MPAIYDNARVRLLRAELDWESIELVLIAWGGEPDFVPTDDAVGDIDARANAVRLAESLAVIEASVSPDGSAQTGAAVVPGVPIGMPVTWLTLCEKNASPSLHRPILSIEDAIGLPMDPNGLDLVVQPDWLAMRGWFKC